MGPLVAVARKVNMDLQGLGAPLGSLAEMASMEPQAPEGPKARRVTKETGVCLEPLEASEMEQGLAAWGRQALQGSLWLGHEVNLDRVDRVGHQVAEVSQASQAKHLLLVPRATQDPQVARVKQDSTVTRAPRVREARVGSKEGGAPGAIEA